jgi:uncharacterized membrane protein
VPLLFVVLLFVSSFVDTNSSIFIEYRRVHKAFPAIHSFSPLSIIIREQSLSFLYFLSFIFFDRSLSDFIFYEILNHVLR